MPADDRARWPIEVPPMVLACADEVIE